MSHPELIEDLRARGRARVEKLWDDTRREAARFEEEQAAILKAEENSCVVKARQAGQSVKRRLMVGARREASAIATRAEHELDRRLFVLAEEMLGQLWPGSRSELLERLVAEVPGSDWDRVIVHHDDAGAAREVFPKAEIREDPAIRGGLVASSEDGGLTVVNTLHGRLERAWPWLGPAILREVAENEIPG